MYSKTFNLCEFFKFKLCSYVEYTFLLFKALIANQNVVLTLRALINKTAYFMIHTLPTLEN